MSTLPSQTEAAASKERRNELDLMRTFRERPTARQELLPDLADQLRAAVQQAEQAVLEISEKFMNIAGRARRQLQATADIVGRMAKDQQTASGSPAERTAKSEKLVSTLAGLSAETDKLGQDINGIITSLQFQDITRQQIEKVIGRIEQFQLEVSDMKRGLELGKTSASGPEGLCAVGPEVNRGEHA